MPPSYTTPSSLETVYPKANITCSRCGSLALGDQQSSFPSVETEIGSFRWLPRIPSIPWDSVAHHRDSELNEGAGNHPCVPAMISTCGHMAFCLPVTSFGGDGIQRKYSRASDPREIYERYLPLAEPNTPSTHSKGLLEYEGERTIHQSYIHLDFGYWIERKHLQTKFKASLTAASFAVAKLAYAEAETQRQVNGPSASRERLSRSRSPPQSRSNSPPVARAVPFVPWRSGLPTPSPSPPAGRFPDCRSASAEKHGRMAGKWR